VGKAKRLKIEKAKEPLKLDFGCGPNKREGFQGVDQYGFDGKVDFVVDLTKTPWPWADGSVGEAHASHFIEHLTADQRVAFVNELYRVLTPGGTCQIIVPHWASCRAYGDPTHQWPPVSEFWFFYLSKDWRENNAPHTDRKWNAQGFACDFVAAWGYNMNENLLSRNEEYRQFALTNYKEAALDMIATLTKR
jgi:SAM-dependent methyltransferase